MLSAPWAHSTAVIVGCLWPGQYNSSVQAANDWQPDAACEAFIDAHGSDPWVLEYRERGRQFRATGRVTLDQVQAAFRSYLVGGSEWRTEFVWGELEL